MRVNAERLGYHSQTSGESLRLGGDIVIVFCFIIVVAMFDRSAQAVCTNVAQDDCVRYVGGSSIWCGSVAPPLQ